MKITPLLNIISSIHNISYSIINHSAKNLEHLIAAKLLEGKYVKKEEFAVLQKLILKLQQQLDNNSKN